MPGLKIGYLPQEPQLDPTQTVREAVEQGIGGVLAAKKRLDEVYAAYAEPDADFDKLAAEQAELEAHHRRRRQREHRPAARDRRRRAAPAAVGRVDRQAVRRREAPRRAVPAAAVQARHAAARRADQPPGRRDRWNGWRSSCKRFPGTVVAITHDRYFLDNAAEWILELDRGRGIPYKGNYSDWLEQKEAAPGAGAEDRGRAHQGDEEGAGVGALRTPRAARPRARRAWRASRSCRDVEYQKRNETNEIFIPVGERLGNEVIEFKNVSKSFGDRAADRRPELQGAGRRHRRHHRPQRRRQVDAVPHDPGQGKARQRRGRDRPDRAAGLRRPEPRRAWPTTRRCGRTSPAAWTTSSSASS